jgi:hypothetical protein
VSPTGASAAELVGLTPEQITQLESLELAKGKLRTGTISAVYDALYRQAASGKLKEETRLLGPTLRLAQLREERERLDLLRKATKDPYEIANLESQISKRDAEILKLKEETRLAPIKMRLEHAKERREQLELQRKQAKTAFDLKKIDAETTKLDLEMRRLRDIERIATLYWGRMVDIPKVGKMSVGHIIRFRPELIDKMFNTLEKERLRLEEARFLSSERKDLWDNIMQELGVSDFFGLGAKAQEKFLEIARRGYKLWNKGEGLDPFEAAMKAAKEGKKSFQDIAGLPERETEIKIPEDKTKIITEFPPLGTSEEVKKKTIEAIKKIGVDPDVLYSEIFKALVEKGWSEEEAKAMMREALRESGSR